MFGAAYVIKKLYHSTSFDYQCNQQVFSYLQTFSNEFKNSIRIQKKSFIAKIVYFGHI